MSLNRIKKLKRDLAITAASLLTSLVALGTSTYAWYVTSNSVTATTTTISATTNGFILQISTLEKGIQHGGAQESLQAFSEGSVLSPASTDDLINWYICSGWDEQGRINSYRTPVFNTMDGAKPGNYRIDGKDYYAFIRSDYILYTINATGTANIYLDASDGVPITVTASDGTGVATITDSIRVAITTQALGADGQPEGEETLRVVYSPRNEVGVGNDLLGIAGWTCIKNISGSGQLQAVSYPYIYDNHYTDQRSEGKNWAAVLSADGENYSVPAGSEAIAENVGYDGIVVHVYIWMEGTDADCVNGKSIEDDPNTYSVTVKFAGVAP